MQLVCTRDDLQHAIAITEKAVAVRSTIPVIGNLHLETHNNVLTLSGYDLEVGIKFSVNTSIQIPGSLLIAAKTFSGIVSKLNAGEVKLQLEGAGQLKITNQNSKFHVHSLPADEFPKFPTIENPQTLKISNKDFKNLIKRTIMAVSNDETKQVLNGILFDFGSQSLSCVATDGYRLALAQQPLNEKVKTPTKIIIPTKALNELNRVLPESGELDIKFSKDHVAFETANFYLVSRIIQGQFPDYKQVIPKEVKSSIVVERKALMAVCERSAIIAQASANIVHVEAADGELHVSASAPGVGNFSEYVKVEIKGSAMAPAAFNVRLILDALKIIDEDEVFLELTGQLSPGMIKPKNGVDYTYVVMPIKTAEPVSA